MWYRVSDTSLIFKRTNITGFIQFNWADAFLTCPPYSNSSNGFVYVGRSDGKINRYNPFQPVSTVISGNIPVQQFSKTSADSFTFITNAE